MGRLRRELGEGYEVLVPADRGLESAILFETITALGWHPLMRVKASGTFQPRGWHKGYAMRELDAKVGRRWAGVGVLRTALMVGEPMPMPRRDLEQHRWPPREWEPDPLTEEDLNEC